MSAHQFTTGRLGARIQVFGRLQVTAGNLEALELDRTVEAASRLTNLVHVDNWLCFDRIAALHLQQLVDLVELPLQPLVLGGEVIAVLVGLLELLECLLLAVLQCINLELLLKYLTLELRMHLD